MTCSRKKESLVSVPGRVQPGPAQSAAPSGLYIVYTSCVWRPTISTERRLNSFKKLLICKVQVPSQKLINLPCRYGLLLLFHPFIHWQIFSLFLIYFIQNSVGVVPTPLSRYIASVKLIRLGVVGPDVHGLASSPACLQINSHSF